MQTRSHRTGLVVVADSSIGQVPAEVEGVGHVQREKLTGKGVEVLVFSLGPGSGHGTPSSRMTRSKVFCATLPFFCARRC
jgi:hypothetical protein